MSLKKIVICCSLIVSSLLVARPSEAGVIFLDIGPGARATGMGNSFVAIADDATATYWNPAGLGFQTGKEISAMHVNWLPGFGLGDMYYDFFAYKQEVDGLGTIGGNITYFYLGEMQRKGEDGRDEGTFTTYEMATSLSYGTMLSEDLSVGINAKFIYSHLSPQGAGAEKGSGVGHSAAIDLGVLYMADEFNVGAMISNIGPKISYIDHEQADPLPTNLKVGAAYYLHEDEFSSFVVTGDINKTLVRRGKDLGVSGPGIDSEEEKAYTDPIWKAIFTSWTDDDNIRDVIWSIGTEYWYGDNIGLRAGYSHDDMGKIKAWTYGASLKYDTYIFDFSYLNAGDGHPLSQTMRFSLNVLF